MYNLTLVLGEWPSVGGSAACDIGCSGGSGEQARAARVSVLSRSCSPGTKATTGIQLVFEISLTVC